MRSHRSGKALEARHVWCRGLKANSPFSEAPKIRCYSTNLKPLLLLRTQVATRFGILALERAPGVQVLGSTALRLHSVDGTAFKAAMRSRFKPCTLNPTCTLQPCLDLPLLPSSGFRNVNHTW